MEPSVTTPCFNVRDVNDIPVFVSSSDAYSDIWPAFFALFKRNWPSFRGTIYLNTESRRFSTEGLKIVCTNVGPQKCFGRTFLTGLRQVPEDRFLLLMIDYFFEQPVRVQRLQHLYDVFCRDEVESLQLFPQACAGAAVPGCDDCAEAIEGKGGGETVFSFQAAFWRRDALPKYVAPWETPWLAEYFGCRRSWKTPARRYVLRDASAMPIAYDGSGVLHGGGKWLDSALAKIDLSGIPLDLSNSPRAHYVASRHPYLVRVSAELKLISRRLKSMFSLFRI